MATLTAVYRDGVLKPATRLDYPEGSTVTIDVVVPSACDAKDALMDNEDALLALYAPFASEERQLAEDGLGHYSELLQREENLA